MIAVELQLHGAAPSLIQIDGLRITGGENPAYRTLAEGLASNYSPSNGDPEVWISRRLLTLMPGKLLMDHSPAAELVGFVEEIGKRAESQIDIADHNVSAVANGLIRAVEVVQSQLKLNQLEALLEQGNWDGIMRYLDLENRLGKAAQGAGLQPDETSFQEALTATWQQGARAELDRLGKVPVRKDVNTIGVMIAFDLLSPEAIAFLSTYVMKLIREISTETRLAIQEVVSDAFKFGGHPYEQARAIRGMIGLTRIQSQAVNNFRKMLTGDPSSMREALTRALRDKRFDPTVARAAKLGTRLSKEQVDKMTQRYYDRYLQYRARNIARTETIRASHMGQRETWRQAVQQGLLNLDTTRQKWIITPDDRLCDFCKSVQKLNPDGVLLEEMFESKIGPVDGPPLHPSCRCTTGLVFTD